MLAGLLFLGACSTLSPKAHPEGRVQTTEQANRQGLKGMAMSPLRDVNVIRTKVPPILLDAADDPYRRPIPLSCQQLNIEVARLDVALGGDIDAPVAEKKKGLINRGNEEARDLLAGAATDMIPFRGWIRKLSGAERHDKLVISAIEAGAIRRAYLKGMGESMRCQGAARPAHNNRTEPDRFRSNRESGAVVVNRKPNLRR